MGVPGKTLNEFVKNLEQTLGCFLGRTPVGIERSAIFLEESMENLN